MSYAYSKCLIALVFLTSSNYIHSWKDLGWRQKMEPTKFLKECILCTLYKTKRICMSLDRRIQAGRRREADFFLPDTQQTFRRMEIEKNTGWCQVHRRKKYRREFDINGKAVTFYVQNFPSDWNNAALWKMFNRYGKVVDLYITKKLN